MPEATAINLSPAKPEQVADSKGNVLTYRDQQQVDFQNGVQNNLAAAGIKHDPVPVVERLLPPPSHIPSGETVTTGSAAVDVPRTHKPNKFLDDLGHILPDVDLTNEEVGQSAAPRTGSNISFLDEARKKKSGPQPGLGKRFSAWLRDEEAA